MNDTVPHDMSGGAASANTVRGRSESTVGPSGSHYIIGPLHKASGPRKKEKTAMSHFRDTHHTAVLSKTSHANCCTTLTNQPSRGRRGRFVRVVQQLACEVCERTAVGAAWRTIAAHGAVFGHARRDSRSCEANSGSSTAFLFTPPVVLAGRYCLKPHWSLTSPESIETQWSTSGLVQRGGRLTLQFSEKHHNGTISGTCVQYPRLVETPVLRTSGLIGRFCCKHTNEYLELDERVHATVFFERRHNPSHRVFHCHVRGSHPISFVLMANNRWILLLLSVPPASWRASTARFFGRLKAVL